MFDLPFENVELAAEYSRLNPWVYTHKYPAATFTNNGYDMGHWVGQNGDDFYLELQLAPVRSLRFELSWELYRKGGLKDISYQYQTPSQPFLYGPVRKQESIGLFGQFQFVRDGFIDLEVHSVTLTDEANPSANVDGANRLPKNVRLPWRRTKRFAARRHRPFCRLGTGPEDGSEQKDLRPQPVQRDNCRRRWRR